MGQEAGLGHFKSLAGYDGDYDILAQKNVLLVVSKIVYIHEPIPKYQQN